MNYISRSISRQGEPGPKWHYDVKAVYMISLLNFRREDISHEFRTDVALMDMKHKTLFSDRMRMVFLQLPYFTKEVDECETVFDKMIYTLKHMDVLQRLPWPAQDAVFQKLSSIADVASLSKEDRRKYDANLKAYRDTIAVMEGQYLEGEQKGIEKGLAKGRAEGEAKGIEKERKKNDEERRESARKLRDSGVPVALIASSLGLSEKEISEL